MSEQPRSFQLDSGSVNEFASQWYVVVPAVAVVAVMGYFGWFSTTARLAFVILGAIALGGILRGRVNQQIREQYPNARYPLLASIALSAVTLGVFCRMAMPQLQGSYIDISWIGLSFVTLLAFIVINRHDGQVMR